MLSINSLQGKTLFYIQWYKITYHLYSIRQNAWRHLGSFFTGYSSVVNLLVYVCRTRVKDLYWTNSVFKSNCYRFMNFLFPINAFNVGKGVKRLLRASQGYIRNSRKGSKCFRGDKFSAARETYFLTSRGPPPLSPTGPCCINCVIFIKSLISYQLIDNNMHWS